MNSDQIYNEDFTEPSRPHITIDSEGERISSNLESTGREEIRSKTEMEECLLHITSQFTNTLQDLTRKFNAPHSSRTPPKHYYAGLDHEDPELFIKQMEGYFKRMDIHEDVDRIDMVEVQFRGEARRWYEPYRHLVERYFTFRDRFLNYFNSNTKISAAMARLYGEKQGNHELVAVFITRKRSLFYRLDSRGGEEVMARVILDQLNPEIKSRLRGKDFLTVEDLVDAATLVENDLKEVERPSWRSQTYNQPTQKPSTQQSVNFRNGHANDTNVIKPPTPCKYCHEWHYHAACPKNPYRQGNPQENSRTQNYFSPRDAPARDYRNPHTRDTRKPPVHRMEVVAQVHAEDAIQTDSQ